MAAIRCGLICYRPPDGDRRRYGRSLINEPWCHPERGRGIARRPRRAGENQCTVNMVGWSDSPREIDSPRLAYKARPFHLGFQAAVRAAALYETRELLRWQNYTEMAAFAELFVIKSRESQLWHGPVIVLCASDEQGVRLGSLRT